MKSITKNEENLTSLESPFTELFSLLKRYDNESGCPTLVYDSDELKVIHQHVENAMEILLQGLRGIGQLISKGRRG